MSLFINYYVLKIAYEKFKSTDQKEFKQFISCENDLKFKCLYETLYYCGLRRGEARALTWNDIDLDNRIIKINKLWWIKINKKNFRTAPLDGATFPYKVRIEYTVNDRKYEKNK